MSGNLLTGDPQPQVVVIPVESPQPMELTATTLASHKAANGKKLSRKTRRARRCIPCPALTWFDVEFR
jgi:hypothetical protein